MTCYRPIVPIVLLVSAAAFAQAPGTGSGDFADAPEKALVEKNCTACHAAAQATSQRHSKAEWATIVNTMIGFGAQVSDDDYAPIVTYLATHYPELPARPR